MGFKTISTYNYLLMNLSLDLLVHISYFLTLPDLIVWATVSKELVDHGDGILTVRCGCTDRRTIINTCVNYQRVINDWRIRRRLSRRRRTDDTPILLF